ncbi:ABC_transporter family protein [Hexamita inflata]|uniref:ABC_transporter family protein n=1 Tax=Hexamita inflata TaxID=28002 RepID=A0ABP1GWW8_9EUKA
MKKQHEGSKMNSKELQSLPDRERVTLFDVQNEPFTQLIGGIIRKQIFLNSPVGDQSPWRFSYSLTSRTMPYLGDPEISADAGSAVLEYASSLKLAQIVVSGLMPMLFAALKFGGEIELNTLKLLNLHTVSGLQWIMNSWMYFAFCAVIIVVLNLCGELIFLPEILSQRVNIIYHFIQALESICTGMLIAAVTKRGKPASITSFLLILFVMIFIILNFGGKVFAFIIGIILPAFTCSYLTQLSQNHDPISVSVLIFGLVFSVLQMLLVFYLVGKDKIMNRTKMQKIKQNHSDEKQSQEVLNQPEKVQSENISTQSQTSVKTFGTDLELIIMQSTIATQTPVIASPDVIQDTETVNNLGLQLQNVHHKYNNSTYAVQGASMDIPRGQIFGLLGSNGSGKSTLMHCMAGMFKPQQGYALVPDNGQVVDLFQLKNSTRYFSVVPQHDVFWPNLTISQHLQLMQLYNAMEVDVELLLKELKLTEFKNQTAQTLSGGQKRRLSIAMAMTMQPKVLAFDEPSCGLGVTTKRFVHQAILNVLSKDTTLLLTTHDMEEVEALVDQCCIMHLGKVLKIGSVAQMCAQQKFDLKIRGNDALVQVLVEELRCEYPVKNAVCDFWCFTVTNMGQLQIMNVLNSHGLLESEWIIEAAKMEQIFMEVVDSAQ